MARQKPLTKQERARRRFRALERPAFHTDVGPPLTAGLPDKRDMAEALHVTCFECGYGAGRHSTSCSRSTR